MTTRIALLSLFFCLASWAAIDSPGLFDNTPTEEALDRGDLSLHSNTPTFDELVRNSRTPEIESSQLWNLIENVPTSDPIAEAPSDTSDDAPAPPAISEFGYALDATESSHSNQLLVTRYDEGPPDRESRACVAGPASALTCHNGAATWRFINDANQKIYADSGCATVCNCGDADQQGPCYGCGYQKRNSNTYCYSDSGCLSVCTPVPELAGGSTGRYVLGLFVVTVVTSRWLSRVRLMNKRRRHLKDRKKKRAIFRHWRVAGVLRPWRGQRS